MLLYSSLAAALGLAARATAQTWPYDIIGTWSTKSNKTLTGPGFYDPLVSDRWYTSGCPRIADPYTHRF